MYAPYKSTPVADIGEYSDNKSSTTMVMLDTSVVNTATSTGIEPDASELVKLLEAKVTSRPTKSKRLLTMKHTRFI